MGDVTRFSVTRIYTASPILILRSVRDEDVKRGV